MLTVHAEKRMQQRGINKKQVEAVLAYGEECFTKGCVGYSFSSESAKQMGSDGYKSSLIERCTGIYIICKDSVVITTCHSKQRYRHH